jgi:Ni2+-binding GTPase involved in maturation of urease and hydrogenase
MNVEQMVDLVNYVKSNVEKFEKRLIDTRADIEIIKTEKRKEEESLKA